MDKTEAIERLREILSPHDKVYLILRHVSASGMTRWISPMVFREGRALDLTYAACYALGINRSERHEGVRVEGVGMDMGFHLLYELGGMLFPDGFGERCLADWCMFRPQTKDEAEHCNDGFDNHRFRGRNGDTSGWDNSGSYALIREWL